MLAHDGRPTMKERGALGLCAWGRNHRGECSPGSAERRSWQHFLARHLLNDKVVVGLVISWAAPVLILRG